MFTSLRSRIGKACLLGCVSGAALLVLAAGQASAATYPGGGSTFTGGAEGWKVASTECKVSGAVEVLCTTNGSGYDGTAGDPAGSLADKAQIPVNALGLFKAAFVNESPTFTASRSGSGSLSLSRQFVPGGLLPVTPTFTYTAYLVDKTTNSKQKALTETTESESQFVNKTGTVSVNSGDEYAIQIEATISANVAAVGLLGEALARFDNVSLTTPGGGDEGRNGQGNHRGTGGSGGQGGNGAGGVSSARLESLLKSSSLVGPAVLKGNKLTVKAKCPKKVNATCTITLTGMLNRHKPATTNRRARVKKGKQKTFALKVKPAARRKVKTKKKLLFKESVKAGKAHATVYKTLKLVRKK